MPAYRAEQTLAKTVADIPGGCRPPHPRRRREPRQHGRARAQSSGSTSTSTRRTAATAATRRRATRRRCGTGADVVVLLHPDYQYEPKAVPLLIAPILAGDADMTFGSRFAGLGDPIGGGMPLYRYVGNRVTTVLENLMLGSRFTEMHSGLRAYTRRCLLSLPFLRYSDDFVFDSQLLVDAVTSGQRVVEVPIPTRYTRSRRRSGSAARSATSAGASATARAGRRGAGAADSAMRWLIPSARSHPSLPTQRPSRANATFAAPSGKQSFLRVERDQDTGGILQCTRCGFASLSRVQMRRESNLQAADGSPPNDGLLVGRLVLDTVGGYLVGATISLPLAQTRK